METYTREEAKTETTDDPKARELLRRALRKPHGGPIPLEDSKPILRINVNGEETSGKVTVKSSKGSRSVSSE